ncbi:MAG: hypothetical protein H8E14_02145 [Candidatus Marinimicrobia bacterium]|nr:hypothetical protein [Candidatus Neomarinimicrobiota bacterium]
MQTQLCKLKLISIWLFITVIIGIPGTTYAQEVIVTFYPSNESGFTEYVTYYLSGFDIQTGKSNVPFFKYTLVSNQNQYPADVELQFSLKVKSPALGMNSPEEIMQVETNRFRMLDKIVIDSRDFSKNTAFLIDEANNVIPLQVTTFMDASKFDVLISSIITSGKIVDGQYTFTLTVKSARPGAATRLTDEVIKIVDIRTPTSIQLQSPGGALADTNLNVIYTTYPMFLWSTDQCNTCIYSIRIAEFDPNRHSSPIEAIEDETVLPLKQSDIWFDIPAGNSFDFPLSGARLLLADKTYVWQIRKTFKTTAGTEEILSSIYSFKIGDVSAPGGLPTTTHPIVQALMKSLGDDQFNALFGPDGTYQGYLPSGSYSLNGSTIDESSASYILSQIANQNVTVTGVRVE